VEAREPALPELPVQYADYAAWQRAWLTGAALEGQLGYWTERLAGAPPVLELPTDGPRPTVQGHRGLRASLLLPATLVEGVQALSRREGATPFMTLLAAWQLLLGRLAGQDDVVVGTPVANRTRTQAEGLVGYFVNSLALRTDLSGEPTFLELLARVRESTLGAFQHQDVPFEQVLEAVRPERSLSHAPVFQVFFNLFNFEESAVQLPGLVADALPWGAEEQAKFDLTLYLAREEEGIRLSMLYDADLFGPARTAEMLEQFRLLLEQAVARPEAAAASYSLVTAAARERIPDPALPLAAEWAGPVTAMFAAQGARSPERLAVRDAEGSWSYGELDRRSARLAHALLAGGVQPGEVVAVYAHRSAPLVWALLGILRAGAAFVVLDPAYPALRLEAYLRAARPAGWLRIAAAGEPPAAVEEAAAATARCSLVLPGPAAAGGGPLDGFPAHDPEVRVGPDSLAYLAFTSGTTGAPRGIAGTHRPLSHFVRWQRDAFALVEDDRFTLLSGLAHDPLLRDVLTPLSLGASVHVPDPERVGAPGWLGAWMAREAVTVAHLTPAMGAVLATAADARLPRLRLAFWGGEAVSAADAARLRGLAPAARSVVFYGATETPQAVAWHPVPEDAAPGGGALPVGRGIEGAQLLVLGRGGEQAGIGEAGEIAVRTPYLALGYLDDEAGTRERFVANPATGDPADRMYRTGDLGRYRPDGAVDFLGRADHQVKVRGFRVEPREVEAALERHASVREAAVVARADGDAGRRLVAYVVAEGAAADAAALRLHLRGTLPEYMVPAAFVTLERLPLTPNGKLDRRALPAPEWAADAGAYAAPRTPVEEVLAEVFADVLRTERVGVHHGFFDLGGHSLLATRLVARVRGVLGVELPLRAVFEAPTVAGLAQRAEAALAEGSGAAAPPLARVPRDGPLPLSWAQQRLWILDQLEPGTAAYNMPSVLRLRGRLDAAGIRWSLGEVVRRHEALRTTFPAADGVPVQRVAPPAPLPLPEADLRGLDPVARDAEARRRAWAEAVRPFDLARGPLLRALLLRLADDEAILHFTVHHVVTDGWSMGVLAREVAALYGAYVAGEASPLPELEVQYGDYAAWQRAWLAGETLERQLDFWRERLAGAPPVLELPTDHPRPPVQGHRARGPPCSSRGRWPTGCRRSAGARGPPCS
jgi:amino acid adenylation domain-containing protein